MKLHLMTVLVLSVALCSFEVRAQELMPMRNTVWASPAELFYKQQVGYEHCFSHTKSLGVQAARYSGFRGLHAGWHATLFGRRYFRDGAPLGFYFQAQISVYEHEQTTSIVPIDDQANGAKSMSYRWSGMGWGPGLGIGRRFLVLKTPFQNHLSVDAMLGPRIHTRPDPEYDRTKYRTAADFLPESFDWFLIGPGSILHGSLAVGYSF